MRQFILPDFWDGGPSCLIEGDRAHYLAKVLRLEAGDSFPGLDPSGRVWHCTVKESSPGRVLLAVSAASPVPGSAKAANVAARRVPKIILAQGLPKGAKMDLVIRQAVEAGVSAVLPLLTARAVPKSGESGGTRMTRWDRIVREALQQSGSEIKTEVAAPLELRALPAALAARGLGSVDPRILLHETPLAQSSMHGYLTEASEAIALCVGPEGGFSREEVDFLLAEGFKPLRLAGAVLRAETAALYAVAAAQIVLSERSSWIPKPP